MKITVLGCGSSGGVPLIGGTWGACDPNEPRNFRRRASILIEEDSTTLLVDTSPDLREQALTYDLKRPLDAVLYTHEHADHCHGLNDLRGFNWLTNQAIPVYGTEHTLKAIQSYFSYAFEPLGPSAYFYKPLLIPHVLKGSAHFGPLTVQPFTQEHGPTMTTLGFRVGDFAYSTDVRILNEEAFEVLRGVKVWIVDGVRERPHPTHAHVAQTLAWIERVRPEQAYLTHMDESLDYATLAARLPAGVAPAYDGMVIHLPAS